MPVNWDQIVLAHSKWKRELQRVIETNQKLDAGNIAKDNLCDLGKWIYGEGAGFASLPAYNDLKQKHTKFHLLVADIIRQTQTLPPDKALELIDPVKSEFGRVSSECILAINALKALAH